MKIPRKVIIGGAEFKVEFPHVFEERDDIFGRIDFATQKIYVTNVASNGQKCSCQHSWQIFWHEILHGIDKQFCANQIGEEIDKERLIEGLAIGMVQVLRDNFGLGK